MDEQQWSKMDRELETKHDLALLGRPVQRRTHIGEVLQEFHSLGLLCWPANFLRALDITDGMLPALLLLFPCRTQTRQRILPQRFHHAEARPPPHPTLRRPPSIFHAD